MLKTILITRITAFKDLMGYTDKYTSTKIFKNTHTFPRLKNGGSVSIDTYERAHKYLDQFVPASFTIIRFIDNHKAPSFSHSEKEMVL